MPGEFEDAAEALKTMDREQNDLRAKLDRAMNKTRVNGR